LPLIKQVLQNKYVSVEALHLKTVHTFIAILADAQACQIGRFFLLLPQGKRKWVDETESKVTRAGAMTSCFLFGR